MFLIFVHIVVFIAGLLLALATVGSAVRVFVVPRGVSDRISYSVFVAMHRLFDLVSYRLPSYGQRDQLMALYAPFSLIVLPMVWISLVLTGYMCMFWAAGSVSWLTAFTVSGSSLLTLGFAVLPTFWATALTFSEAAIGLLLVALLISYLPTMYSAFSQREAQVSLLEVRAGSPPDPAVMILRFNQLGNLGRLLDMCEEWERWFVTLEETHTSLAALPFFRSPRSNRSWVTASATVLDTTALIISTLDLPQDARPAMCMRAGWQALRRIADLFEITHNQDPHYPQDPISVSRAQFDEAYDRLAQGNLPLKQDRDQAWLDYAGWRVNYDRVVCALAGMTMAPEAPWVTPLTRKAMWSAIDA